MIGKSISHYKILEKLGEGGMGVVYKAQDLKLDRLVALKFLPPHLASDEQDKERFIHEAKAASSLDHPNICTVYEIGETPDGQLFIAMAYYKGETLQQKIRPPLHPPLPRGETGGSRSPLPLDDAITYAIQTAEGLQAAHKKGITHRDIKSSNVMVTAEEQIKIMDFGLAKTTGATMVTKTGATVGTVPYMSPEQARGEKVDHRTDIWSLGVVMYETISGRLPFPGEYEQAMVFRILNEEAEPLTSLRSNVPIELERIVRKTMAKSPGERYQHIEDLLVDLRAFRNKLLTSGHAGRMSTAISPSRKKPFVYGAIVVVALLLAAGSIYLLKYAKGTDAQDVGNSPSVSVPATGGTKRLAVLPFANIRGDAETDFLGFALADQVIGSLTYLKSLLVRPSSAVRPYQYQTVDAVKAAHDLQVEFILTGHYLKEAEVVRLNLELVDVRANEMIWREHIEVRYNNIFELQNIVEARVIDGLRVYFSPDERGRQRADIPRNPAAYDSYLRAIAYPRTVQGDETAVKYLENSIRLDSTFAPAYAELGARLHGLLGYALKEANLLQKAESANRRALSLNPELVSAMTNLARLYTEIGRTEDAVGLTRRMIEINANDASAHFSLSYIYRYAGMLEESEREVEKALAVDPSNPRFRSSGITYFYLGKYDKALASFDLDQGSTFSIAWTGLTLYLKEDTVRALSLMDRVIAVEPDGHFGIHFAAIKAFITGNIQDGLRSIQRLEEKNPSDSETLYFMANSYSLLGEKSGCLRLLRKAIDEGYFNYAFMVRDKFLDSVRDDPEFKQLLALAKTKHEAFVKKLTPAQL